MIVYCSSLEENSYVSQWGEAASPGIYNLCHITILKSPRFVLKLSSFTESCSSPFAATSKYPKVSSTLSCASLGLCGLLSRELPSVHCTRNLSNFSNIVLSQVTRLSFPGTTLLSSVDGDMSRSCLVLPSLHMCCHLQLFLMCGLLCSLTFFLGVFTVSEMFSLYNDGKMTAVMPNTFNMGTRYNLFGRIAEVQVNCRLHSFTWICIWLKGFCGWVFTESL